MILRVDLHLNENPATQMKIRVYSEASKSAIQGYVSKKAQEMELYMKKKHKWKNRTGNAEGGLNAKISKSEHGWRETIELSHGQNIWYGVYLEYAMEKRFAIIEPTLTVFLPRIQKELNSIFNDVKIV